MENISEEQKVLIVDDEPANIRILIETLKGRYHLIGATCGKEALDCALSDDPPDLILLDILMPDMDGYEVCARLKHEERTRHIPVIFITVMEEDADEARGFELGAVDYITKPFSPATVNARVKTHLELKRHRDRLECSLRESAEKLSDSARKLLSESHGRIRAEQEREQLSTAVEHAAEAFIITDPEGIIQYVNPVFQEYTGYSREEAAGRSLGILDSGQKRDADASPGIPFTTLSGKVSAKERACGASLPSDAKTEPCIKPKPQSLRWLTKEAGWSIWPWSPGISRVKPNLRPTCAGRRN